MRFNSQSDLDLKCKKQTASTGITNKSSIITIKKSKFPKNKYFKRYKTVKRKKKFAITSNKRVL